MTMSEKKLPLPDRIVSWLNPEAGVRRAHARQVLAYFEAAKPDRLRKSRRETGSGNDAVLRAGATLRQLARHQEQNHDLALGVLNTLVNNTVGAQGIGIEPQPRKRDGTIDDKLAREILKLHKDWARNPEVTRQHDWPSAQRLLARSWFRDGEVFSQQLIGQVFALDHGTEVPYSIEMLECDFVPMDMSATQPTIQQGVEINAWGRPVAYHVYKADPNESQGFLRYQGQTKRIAAGDMLHLKTVHRIRQLRGVSVFASVLNRFDDLKDYEESERIAAKIAASMAAFIRKGSPDQYTPDNDEAPRSMRMRPGMIFDDLKPGEEIGTIDTNRPNPNLETYRSGQLRAVAAGAGPTYSSIARNYNGTYSAQRQELVEGWSTYAVLAAEFTSRIVRPVYESFIATAVASGKLRIPADVDRATLNDAIYLAPQMPWIDPKKEAEAYAILEDRAYVSGPEIVRKRGGNPIDVIEQQARWLREKADNGIPSANATAGPALAADANADDL
jgi:lambda family phage portal protein